jgi:hypothetical protein
MIRCTALEEREFSDDRNEVRVDRLACPRSRCVNEYRMRYVVRTRETWIPQGADARDRALFATLRDFTIRVEDAVRRSNCGRQFDVPSQHSLAFLQSGSL